MIKQIVASGLLALVLGFSISSTDQCSCDQYYTSAECFGGFCKWNSTLSICTTITCEQLTNYKCYTSNCYWNSTSSQCQTLSSCSQLKGNSRAECQYQNYQCGWISGSSCTEFKCQNYNTTSCPYDCYNNGISCQEYTSCSQHNISTCFNPNMCYWKNDTCVPAQCEMFSGNTCKFVITYLKAGQYQLTPCYLNDYQYCQNATTSQFVSPLQCHQNTLGLYHWSSNKETQGSCVACKQATSSSSSSSSSSPSPSVSDSPNEGQIVQIMIAIVLLIA